MKFEEYRDKAVTTALPSARTNDYLMPGIISELGEVAGVIAKSVRDDWDDQKTAEALQKEIGDVLWFVAVLSDVNEIGIAPGVSLGGGGPLDYVADSLFSLIFSDDIGPSVTNISTVWFSMKNLAEEAGLVFDNVLNANLAKLQDRQARGVISGSGDER